MKGKNTLNHMLFTPQTQASYSSLTLMQKLSVHPTDRNISVQNEADEAAYNTISKSFMYSVTSGQSPDAFIVNTNMNANTQMHVRIHTSLCYYSIYYAIKYNKTSKTTNVHKCKHYIW